MTESTTRTLATQPITYRGDEVPCRRVIELHIESPEQFANPLHEARFIATFTAPSGHHLDWHGFWDGGDDWRVRFSPSEEGPWRYHLRLLNYHGQSIVEREGVFTAKAPLNETVFDCHGPVQLAADKGNLVHADGTPFFWLADTAWNGPLRSTEEEWNFYLTNRVRQRFNAVQWVATQWRASPQGDIENQPTFAVSDPIAVNPAFFQRLDGKVEATSAAGLLNVPVMLWAVGHGENPDIDPGFGLPESEAVLLARYQVARWAAFPIVWILGGDGSYTGDFAARWRRIGRAVFNDQSHAPVAMHCGGEQWPADEFRSEPWMGILGYQSGHGDSDKTLNWIVNGPPATQWSKQPRLFQLNFEPAYENHLAYHSRQPHTPHSVRMAIYWSLLNAPTAGVSYGGHGVWGWDDGTTAPADHPSTGLPLPWRQALTMPAAQQLTYLVDFFSNLNWWQLTPSPHLLLEQPGVQDVHRTILVSATAGAEVVVAYLPAGGEIHLDTSQLSAGFAGEWCNPRTGERQIVIPTDSAHYTAPDSEDWLLILQPAT